MTVLVAIGVVQVAFGCGVCPTAGAAVVTLTAAVRPLVLHRLGVPALIAACGRVEVAGVEIVLVRLTHGVSPIPAAI